MSAHVNASLRIWLDHSTDEGQKPTSSAALTAIRLSKSRSPMR